MRLGPAKSKILTIRSNKRTSIEPLRLAIREALTFLKEFENIAQVKWKLIITVRERLDG